MNDVMHEVMQDNWQLAERYLVDSWGQRQLQESSVLFSHKVQISCIRNALWTSLYDEVPPPMQKNITQSDFLPPSAQAAFAMQPTETLREHAAAVDGALISSARFSPPPPPKPKLA